MAAMDPMPEKELVEFRQSSNWFMRERMERNQKEFKLDAYRHFAWDAWRGELVFSSCGVPRVVARIQVVGTLAAKSKVWTWAWAKPDLLPPVRQAVLRVRQFGEERGILALIQSKWSANEAEAWQMTAITCRLIDAQGAFMSPGPEGATFMVFTDIRSVSDRKRVFGAQTCSHVLDEDRPILLVSREADGEVLAVCGGEDDSAATTRAVPLDKLLSLDSSLADLADMPDGWVAMRESPDHAWARSPS
jgi:hypothetical protein